MKSKFFSQPNQEISLVNSIESKRRATAQILCVKITTRKTIRQFSASPHFPLKLECNITQCCVEKSAWMETAPRLWQKCVAPCEIIYGILSKFLFTPSSACILQMLRNNSLICDFLIINALDCLSNIFNHNIQPLIDDAYIHFPLLCIHFMLNNHTIIFYHWWLLLNCKWKYNDNYFCMPQLLKIIKEINDNRELLIKF